MVAGAERDRLEVGVRNLGGIDDLETSFEPGVTVLVGRNATNRTSLLQSIVAALGGSAGQLKSSASEGQVQLSAGDRTATRAFRRSGDSVRVDGEPYTDETALVDNYAALLEANPARRAVERGDGDALREIVMAPVDTAALRDRIASTRRELASVEERIDEIERRESNLPALEERRRQRASELADVEDELETLRAELEVSDDDSDRRLDVDAADRDGVAAWDGTGGWDGAADRDGAGSGEGSEDDVVEELRRARREYEAVREDRSTEAAAVASLEEELADVEDELGGVEEELAGVEEELAGVETELADVEAESADVETGSGKPDAPVRDVDDLEAEIERLTREERALSATVSSLQSIVEFNEELLAGDGDLSVVAAEDDPIDELDPASRRVRCWTCGTTVERAEVDDRLADLRSVIEEKRSERDAVATAVEDRREVLAELREHRDELAALRERRDRIEAEIEDRRDRLADLEEREATLRERVDELESRAAERAAEDESDRLERYQQLSELEYERGQVAAALDSIDDEIATIEELTAEREALSDRRSSLAAELESLRNRVVTVETEAVDTFNDEVATVLELLEYANLERVWLERKPGADEGDATFDLHVVRADEDGRVYEDTADHLSESEREVIGLVVALAGYLVHDVHGTVPVMALDSLEAIDADRIATLVGHFEAYAPYVLVALLPGDAQALPERYDRVELYRD